MIRLHSGGENALVLRALRGDHGDTRELLATTRGRPMDDDPATRRTRIEELRTIAAREFQHCDEIDAQIQRKERGSEELLVVVECVAYTRLEFVCFERAGARRSKPRNHLLLQRQQCPFQQRLP